jgi:hypothetical protein
MIILRHLARAGVFTAFRRFRAAKNHVRRLISAGGSSPRGAQTTALAIHAQPCQEDRPARMGRNPTTGAAVQIAASRKVAFRAAKELKTAV